MFFLLQYIDDTLPAESPYLYGLHPNAEIGFLTQTSEKLFRTVLEMQPRDGGVGEGAGTTRDEKVKKTSKRLIREFLPEKWSGITIVAEQFSSNNGLIILVITGKYF